MVKEFNMMRAWGVYELVERPLDANVIGTNGFMHQSLIAMVDSQTRRQG